MVIPHGELSWPSALPRLPHLDRNSPYLVNFCIRWLRLSTMYRTSCWSMAIPEGLSNSPSPFPAEPQQRRKLPSLSKTETRLSHSSVTYTFSWLSSPMPAGQIISPGEAPGEVNWLPGTGPHGDGPVYGTAT